MRGKGEYQIEPEQNSHDHQHADTNYKRSGNSCLSKLKQLIYLKQLLFNVSEIFSIVRVLLSLQGGVIVSICWCHVNDFGEDSLTDSKLLERLREILVLFLFVDQSPGNTYTLGVNNGEEEYILRGCWWRWRRPQLLMYQANRYLVTSFS